MQRPEAQPLSSGEKLAFDVMISPGSVGGSRRLVNRATFGADGVGAIRQMDQALAWTKLENSSQLPLNFLDSRRGYAMTGEARLASQWKEVPGTRLEYVE
jgi:hypothetical protein